MYDAIVIGAGIVGASAAYHLAAAGARTLLIDRGDKGQATAAGAGIITPETAAESDTWHRLAVAAVDYYPHLVAQLAADGAGETGYARCGLLVLAADESEDDAFQAARQRIFKRQREHGRPTAQELYEVDEAQARRLFPPLGPVRSAIYSAVAGRVDGRLMSGALLKAAERRKLETRQAAVERLLIADGAVAGVLVGGEEIHAGAVILASGAWSAEFAEQLGITIPITPVRGQIIHFKVDQQDSGDWPIITAFRGQYIVPWSGGRVAAGATFEPDSGFAPHTTVAGVHMMLAELLRVAPGLAAAEISDIRVGLRPATPDRLPLLGPIPGLPNVFIAAGHAGTGLQLGPYSGKLMADLALGRALADDITPFSVTRFAGER